MSERLDFFGRPINIGDYVIKGTSIKQAVGFDLCIVERMTPKQIISKRLGGNYRSEFRSYPEQLIVVDPDLVTMKLLKENHDH